MAKSHTTISIETDVLEWFRAGSHNMSRICEEALRTIMMQETTGANSINIMIKKKELEKKESQLIEIKTELNSLKEAIKKYEDQRKEKELDRLKQIEKEELLKKSCHHCGKNIKDKFKIGTKKYNLCLDCYATMPKSEIHKYEEHT